MPVSVNNTTEDFKETEIGLIPAEWDVESIGALFELKQGKAMSPKTRRGIAPRPFLRTSNVLWGRVDLSTVDRMDFSDAEVGQLSLKAHDLLVCEGGEVGRTAMWRGEIEGCAYQNHLHRLRSRRQDVWPEFYMYWMQAGFLLLGVYAGRETKTTIANLSGARLGSFPVPVPPLPEQRQISHVLSTIQRAIEVQDRVIVAAKELKRSLMERLFTYGPGPEPAPTKETEIGEIPEAWEVVKFEEVADFRLGRTPRRDEESYWDNSRYPWVSIADMADCGIVRYTREKVSQLAFDEVFNGRIVPRGTLLMSFKLTIGRTSVLGTDAFHNEAIISIYPGDRLLKEYLLYFLPTLQFSNYYDTVVKGKTLNKSKISILPIALPPLAEQREISGILQAADRNIEAEERRASALKALFRSTLHQLMTGRLRVTDLEV